MMNENEAPENGHEEEIEEEFPAERAPWWEKPAELLLVVCVMIGAWHLITWPIFGLMRHFERIGDIEDEITQLQYRVQTLNLEVFDLQKTK